ncbi:MAG: VCBS repeat-containing protein [Myxococcales bacterium]|nr:VCBS repeat-containing protein [Myxococcales bacterium]
MLALAACSAEDPAPDGPFILENGRSCRAGAPAPGVFTESAEALGIDVVHEGFSSEFAGLPLQDFPAVAIADLDGDGALDLLFGNSFTEDTLYLTGGRGPLGFQKSIRPSTIEFPSTRAVVVADLDGDRRRDLVTTNGEQLFVALGLGGGAFAAERELRVAAQSQGFRFLTFALALGDIDLDGTLDLAVGNQFERVGLEGKELPGRELLFRGGAGGTFTEETTWLPTRPVDDLTFLVSLVDLDGDLDLELHEVNDARFLWQFGIDIADYPGLEPLQGDRLYRNRRMEGGGTSLYEDVTTASGAGVAVAGMGGAIADYSGDGLPDIFLTAMRKDTNKLLQNVGGLRFEDRTDAAGADTLTAAHDVGWGALFLDADADGRLDLFVTHGFLEGSDPDDRLNRDEQSNVLLRNVDGSRFEDVTAAAGLVTRDWGRTPVVGDLDRDGFPDLVVGNADGPPRVFLNGCDDRPWLTVRLVGTAPNTDAIGAHLTAESPDGTRQLRILQAGGEGLFGATATEAYFAFPRGTETVRLSIRFPTGTTVTYEAVPTRRLARITEPVQ